ncbi:MAG: hypothetical protein H0X35_14765 [Pseudonocardiales bacterium]|nr:hypothetical protein [Pseudonocardiales bacterium]
MSAVPDALVEAMLCRWCALIGQPCEDDAYCREIKGQDARHLWTVILPAILASDEIVNRAGEAADDEALTRLGRSLGTLASGHVARAALAAVTE